MIKLVILIAILFSLPHSMQQDKLAHFHVGFASGAVSTLIAKSYTQSKPKQLLIALVFAGLLGCGKELHDAKYTTGFSFEDLFYTVSGALTSSILVIPF